MHTIKALWPELIALIFVTLIAYIPISIIVNRLWANLGVVRSNRSSVRQGWWLSIHVGLIERALYLESLRRGAPEIIGFWLALKSVGQWKTWIDGVKISESRIIPGRSVFYVFLIGSGLSVGYSLVAATIIQWLHSGQWFKSIILVSILFLGSIVLWGLGWVFRIEHTKTG